MSHKRIFVLNGHPATNSVSASLAAAYVSSAQEAGHEVRVTHISEISFDSDFGFGGYQEHKPLEPCLKQFQNDLEWCEHFVMMTPMWWGGLPAKLKGLFDRTLLPGWAFDTRRIKRGMPTPLLTDRTARVFVTSDTPEIFFRLLYHRALFRQIKGQILGFIGIKPTKVTHFSPTTGAQADKIDQWVKVVKGLGSLGH
ncbi:NAD(P)H dehydrogenase (quinone) [Amylibacter marinus]|uniref:NAD(P)H dehydrogenase (Quinone) n=1 Tax=Amylibacter marinus TaxID=1475483 RepID=A0ABQ5VUM1_9RHOB|nr:NAD(P)H-dependent oxidoreductase [Amylibacter marinus]GLQ35138.1 NAD(P)H dehydrogenase (quinone) [Amylibacter marinus]